MNPKTRQKEVSLIYLEVEQNTEWERLEKAGDSLLRGLLDLEVIASAELKQMHISYDHNTNRFRNEAYHLTLFRVRDIPDGPAFQ